MKINHATYSTAPFLGDDAKTYLQFLGNGANGEAWLAPMLSREGFPLAMAPMLAHLSNLAYLNDLDSDQVQTTCERQLRDDFGASHISRFENKNAEGYAFVLEDLAFLVFCGTNDLSSDWVDNLLAIRKEHDFGGYKSEDIHMGFGRHFELLRPAIEVWIDQLPDHVSSFVCTGHSLGGSLAVLMAQLLALNEKSVSCVMTFGAPAVGGKRFAEQYAWHARTWRVVDLGDPIPKSTPEYVGFRHVGSAISSRADLQGKTMRNGSKPPPRDISIFPKPSRLDASGDPLYQSSKSMAEKALDIYRERPRHCKNVYRSSMQRMLKEYLPDIDDETLRKHYDYCGMPRVKLSGTNAPLEED